MTYPSSSVLCHVTGPELPSAQEQLREGTVMWGRVAESLEQLGSASRAAFSSLSPKHRVIRMWTVSVWMAILPCFRAKESTQLFFPFVYLKIITHKKTSGETSSSLQKKKKVLGKKLQDLTSTYTTK